MSEKMGCDCYVCQNYEVVRIGKCPTCDYGVNAPLTSEGICLNCTLVKEEDESRD